MYWYEMVLSREQVVEGISEKIQSEFEELFVKAGKPPEMALFCDTFTAPQFSMYFSPVCAQYCPEFISGYSGKPCGKPNASEVNLLVGERDSAWNLLR
jgi:hypothetical protein